MPKGLFTQCACILLDRPTSLDEVQTALSGFDVYGRTEATAEESFGGPSLLLDYRKAVNGLVAVDVVNRPWPDDMGDIEDNPTEFGAWAMGQYGPFTYPGGLERATEQSWTWDDAAETQQKHQAFVRVRASYLHDRGDDAPVVPEDYDAIDELQYVTKVAAALLDLPGALCYFNPGGEVLRDQDGLRESLNFAWANELPPLDSWCNVRLFLINDQWSLMDCVGNSQVDLPDLEACFYSDAYDFGEVDNLLRGLTLYLLEEGEVIEDGDTVDGPGGVMWQTMLVEESLCDPPRSVIRLVPLDDRTPPDEVIETESPEE